MEKERYHSQQLNIRIFTCMLILCCFSVKVTAQVKGDYRSTGKVEPAYWSDRNSWEWYNGVKWMHAHDYPGQKNKANTVTIRSKHVMLIDVDLTQPIQNLVMEQGTISVASYVPLKYNYDLTLLGFATGAPRTLKVARDITLNRLSYLGMNLFDTTKVEVKHTVEVGGNITGKGLPCGLVFSYPGADAINLAFTGSGNSTISGLNPFGPSLSSSIEYLMLNSSMNSITINKDNNAATVSLGQPVYCNTSALTALAGSVGISTPLTSFPGDFTIMQGTFSMENYTAEGAGTFTLGVGQKLRLSGNNFPSFAAYVIDPSSEIEYYGADQIVRNREYGNLTCTGSGVKTLEGPVTVNGTFTISSGVEIAMNNYSLTVNNAFNAAGKLRGSATSDLILGPSATLSGRLVFNNNYATLRNFELNNNSDMTLGSRLTINGSLAFPPVGKIFTTSNNLLTFSASATYTGADADSFVNGPVSKTGSSDFIFPVGKGSFWARIGISQLSASTTFRAEYFDRAYGNASNDGTLGSISEKEHWMLDRTAGSGSARVRLFWEDGIRSGINNAMYANMVVARFNGTNWENRGMTGITGDINTGSVTSSDIPNFSPYTFGTSPAPLPVSLLYFKAVAEATQVQLHWETASEQNNDYFTVERSADGFSFQEVLKVKGAGNSDTAIKYQAADGLPMKGISYYRLKQTDFDGTESYAPLSVADFSESEEEFSLYPNPSQDGMVQIKTSLSLADHDVQLKIYDLFGAEQTAYHLENGEHMLLNMRALRKGTYFVQVSTPTQMKRFKLLLN